MKILAKQRLKAAWFSSSSGRIEFEIDRSEAERVAQSGDNGPAVDHLIKQPHIAQFLGKLKPDVVKNELKEYGAWDDKELSNHQENLKRLLWIACHDIVESDEDENP